MKRLFVALLLLLALALTSEARLFQRGGVTGSSAMRIYDFVQKIGTNGYLDSTSNPPSAEITDSTYLGIKNFRTGIYNNTTGTSNTAAAWFSFVAPLAAAGIRQHFLMDGSPSTPFNGGMSAYLAALKTYIVTPYGANMVAGVTGPNETDVQAWQYNTTTGIAGANQAQSDLYTAMKADPALSSIPVDMWALDNSNAYASVGNQTASCDRFNMHDYYPTDNTQAFAAGGVGGGDIFTQLTVDWIPLYKQVCNRPIGITTESGYGNEPCVGCGSQSADDGTQTRLVLEDLFQHERNSSLAIYYIFTTRWGDSRCETATYPGGGCWGLLNDDGTPKQSGTAIHNLLTGILSDTGSTAATFTPAPFGYSVTGLNASHGYSLVVANSNGKFEIILWEEVPIWNISTATPISVSPHNVTVTFGGGTYNGGYYDVVNHGSTLQSPFTSQTSVTVSMTDAPLIIEVAPTAVTVTNIALATNSEPSGAAFNDQINITTTGGPYSGAVPTLTGNTSGLTVTGGNPYYVSGTLGNGTLLGSSGSFQIVVNQSGTPFQSGNQLIAYQPAGATKFGTTTADCAAGITTTASPVTASITSGSHPPLFTNWGCRVTNPRFRGKLYFEATLNSATNAAPQFGIVNNGPQVPISSGGWPANQNSCVTMDCPTTPGGDDSGQAGNHNSVGYVGTNIVALGANLATMPAWSATSGHNTIGVAVDLNLPEPQLWITADVANLVCNGSGGAGSSAPQWNSNASCAAAPSIAGTNPSPADAGKTFTTGSGLPIWIPGEAWFPYIGWAGSSSSQASQITFNFAGPFVGTVPAGYQAWDAVGPGLPVPGPLNPQTINVANAPPWVASTAYGAGSRVVAGPGWQPGTPGNYVSGQLLYLWAAVGSGGTSGGSPPSGFASCNNPAKYGAGFVGSPPPTPPQWAGATTVNDNGITWTCITQVDYVTLSGLAQDGAPWAPSTGYYTYAFASSGGRGLWNLFGNCTSGTVAPTAGNSFNDGGCTWTDMGPIVYSSMVNRYLHFYAPAGTLAGSVVGLNFSTAINIWYGGTGRPAYHAGANGESLPITSLQTLANADNGLSCLGKAVDTNHGSSCSTARGPYDAFFQVAPGDGFKDNSSPATTPLRINSALGVTIYNDAASSCSGGGACFDSPFPLPYFTRLTGAQFYSVNGNALQTYFVGNTGAPGSYLRGSVSPTTSLGTITALQNIQPSTVTPLSYDNWGGQSAIGNIIEAGNTVSNGSTGFLCTGDCVGWIASYGVFHDNVVICDNLRANAACVNARYITNIYNNTIIGPGVSSCPHCIGIQNELYSYGPFNGANNLVIGFGYPYASQSQGADHTTTSTCTGAANNASDAPNSGFGLAASFTATIAPGPSGWATMTVTGTPTGSIFTGLNVITGAAAGTYIAGSGTYNGSGAGSPTGTGGAGTYIVSPVQTVSSPTAMTAEICNQPSAASVTNTWGNPTIPQQLPGVGSTCGAANNQICDGTVVTGAASLVNASLGAGHPSLTVDARPGSGGVPFTGSVILGAGGASAGPPVELVSGCDIYGC